MIIFLRFEIACIRAFLPFLSQMFDSDQGEKWVDGERLFPPNYVTMVLLFKFLMKCLLIVLGVGK